MTINADRPIERPDQDRYDVGPRLVEALDRIATDWPSEDGLIVGLYGPWGVGKTSVLNLLRARYEASPRAPGRIGRLRSAVARWLRFDNRTREADSLAGVTLAQFNPWYYDHAAALIGSFFGVIAASLDARVEARDFSVAVRKMGLFLTTAASTVSLAGVSVDPSRFIGVGKTLQDGSGLMERGEIDLHRARDNVREHLTKFGRDGGRLVILVDDVDRLGLRELLDLLRLLRLVADLPAITIVVAMDEVRVRAMLEAATELGYSAKYLEKIIQVGLPVALPKRAQVQTEFVSAVRSILDEAGMPFPSDLNPRGWGILDRTLDLITTHLVTPRDVVRLTNSIRALLLTSEARDLHPLDAILVQTLQVFHPAVYDRIRREKTWLTDRPWTPFQRDQEQDEKYRLQFNAIVGLASEQALQPVVASILKELFGEVDSGARPTDDDSLKLGRERRVAAPEFFGTYFLQLGDDLPTRATVESLVDSIETHLAPDAADELAELLLETLGSRSEGFLQRFGLDLQLAFDRLSLEKLEGLADVVIDHVITTNETVGLRLLASVLVSIGNYRHVEGWSRDSAVASGDAVAARAVAALDTSLGYEIMEYARTFRVASADGWKRTACEWLKKAVTSISEDRDAFAPDVLGWPVGAAIAKVRIVSRKLVDNDCEVTPAAVNEAIVGWAERDLARLPYVLSSICVQGGEKRYLVSEFNRLTEALERVSNLFGSVEAAQRLAQAFVDEGGVDDSGLIAEVLELRVPQ